MSRSHLINLAINKLGVEFDSLDLTFHEMKDGKGSDVTSYWPGGENEDILICVFKGKSISEPFHRQDFFFINYAYTGDYGAQSYRLIRTSRLKREIAISASLFPAMHSMVQRKRISSSSASSSKRKYFIGPFCRSFPRTSACSISS